MMNTNVQHDDAVAAMELDVAYGWEDETMTLECVLNELVDGTRVTTTVVQEHGPAGGWPVVKFEGTLADLQVVERRMDGEKV